MNINKETYKKILKDKKDYKLFSKNAMYAFLSGGSVCLIGQILLIIFEYELGFTFSESSSLMIIVMVLIAAILSAFGIYDKIGQVAKCGLIVPITGFANSMVSSAMEYKPEGFMLGISANTFKLAGSVITLGIFFAYIVAFFRYILMVII